MRFGLDFGTFNTSLAVWDGDRSDVLPLDPVAGAAMLEERSPWAVLGFALACWSSAIYGWLAGAWPFTVIEGVWGLVALRRFLARR